MILTKKSTLKKAILIVSMLALMLVFGVVSVLALTGTIGTVTYTTCIQGYPLSVGWTAPTGIDTHMTITNTTRGTTSAVDAHLSFGGETGTLPSFMPALTQPGDTITILTYEFPNPDNNETKAFVCGKLIDSPAPPAPAKPWNPYVKPGNIPASFMSIFESHSYNGKNACGYFALDSTSSGIGWGTKVVYVPRFSDCVPYIGNLTVACWDGANGAWRQDTVTNFTTTEDGYKLHFYSKQDGYCGIFPK